MYIYIYTPIHYIYIYIYIYIYMYVHIRRKAAQKFTGPEIVCFILGSVTFVLRPRDSLSPDSQGRHVIHRSVTL